MIIHICGTTTKDIEWSRSLPKGEIPLLTGANDNGMLTVREVLQEGGADGKVSGVRPYFQEQVVSGGRTGGEGTGVATCVAADPVS